MSLCLIETSAGFATPCLHVTNLLYLAATLSWIHRWLSATCLSLPTPFFYKYKPEGHARVHMKIRSLYIILHP